MDEPRDVDKTPKLGLVVGDRLAIETKIDQYFAGINAQQAERRAILMEVVSDVRKLGRRPWIMWIAIVIALTLSAGSLVIQVARMIIVNGIKGS